MQLLKTKLKKLSSHEIARLMSGASFVFICRVFGAATVLITQILLARWMGAEQLGIFVYVSAWFIMLATFAGLGLPNAVFRFIGKGLADSNDNLVISFAHRGGEIIFISSLLITTVGFLLLTKVDGLISEDKQTTFLIALLAIPAYALMRWYSYVAHALSWFRLAIVPMVVIRPLLLLLAVSLIWFNGFTLTSDITMTSQLGIVLIIIIVQFFWIKFAMHRRFHNFKKNENETKVWLRTSIPLLLSAFFIKNFLELNLIIAGSFLAADQIAIFSVTFRVAFLISFGIHAIDAMTAPRVAKLYAEGDLHAMQSLVYRATQIKFLGALIGVIGLGLYGKLVLAMFGADFVVGYQALIILATSQLIIASFGAGAQLLSVSGHQDQCLIVFVSSAMMLFGLHVLLIPRLGLYGVAIAVVLVVFIQSWLVNELVVRRLRIFPSIISFRKYSNKK